MIKDATASTRRHMRFNAQSANITGSICYRNDAVLHNFSLGGACFLLKEPIGINSSCSVEIRDGAKEIHVTGRVAWGRGPGEMPELPEGLKDMHAVGIVFLNTYNSPSGAGLLELIEKLDS